MRTGCRHMPLALALSLVGCGGKDGGDHRATDPMPVENPDSPDGEPPGNEPHDAKEGPLAGAIVRGRWLLPVHLGGDRAPVAAFFEGASDSQPIGATVAANVHFEVEDDTFVTPEPVDVASYGKLVVTDLRDNALRVCGPSGTDQCEIAALRVYTTGTPGPGLWNDVESYGLPILCGTGVVGLNPAGAHVLQQIAIGDRRTLKLRDFTAAAGVDVPISVDFRDAAAGSYRSTVVVEYVLQ